MLKKPSKKTVKYAIAVLGLFGIVFLIYEEHILATVGKFVFTWLSRSWELMVRAFEFAWRPLLVIGENAFRALAARPFGKLFAWFVAGYILHYLLHPNMRDAYDRTMATLTGYGNRASTVWLAISFHYRVLIIIVGAGGIAIFHAGLLLLPLGFFVEPIVRRVYRWVAQQRLEKTSIARRFNNEVYRHTRIAMRKSPAFRRSLGPLRAIRLRGIRQSRVLHYQYRSQGKGAADMLRDIRSRKRNDREEENESGLP